MTRYINSRYSTLKILLIGTGIGVVLPWFGVGSIPAYLSPHSSPDILPFFVVILLMEPSEIIFPNICPDVVMELISPRRLLISAPNIPSLIVILPMPSADISPLM